MKLDITYRGPLASCNYSCSYCPFAKRHDERAARLRDQDALRRLVHWLIERKGQDTLRLVFTPWGEALTRRWYREAIITLSHYDHIKKIVVQTNLSASLDWLQHSAPGTLALWATYHPGEVSLDQFLTRIKTLERWGVAHSVGIVGKKEHRDEALALRQALPTTTYLWVNAYKDQPNYYNPDDLHFFRAIDPLFDLNNSNHPSLGKACRAGEQAVTIDGEGDLRRCHFVDTVLGNIYQHDIHTRLKPRPCPKQSCDCYIGYVHLKALALERIYGERLLERIPIAQNRTETQEC